MAKKVKREYRFDRNVEALGLSKQLLPPITRRKMAVYELIDFPSQMKMDPRVKEGPNNLEPPPYEMVPSYEIYDPFQDDLSKRRRRLVYSNDITVHDFYNKTAVAIDPFDTTSRIQMPAFSYGQAVVDSEKEYLKYLWWERHPQNASNRFREKTTDASRRPVVKFKRVDIEFKSPHTQMLEMDLALDAERFVIGLNTEQLINTGASMGIPANVKPGEIRLELRKMARNNPRSVLFKLPDPTPATMANILSALDLGILEYNEEKQVFFFDNDDESVYEVLNGESPLESFAKWLTADEKEGQEYKGKIEELLKFWN